MSRDQYNKLLELLDEMITDFHSVPQEEPDVVQLDEFEQLPDYPFGPYFDELSIILTSGIFQDGQLKGRQLTGHAREYKRYQIIELEKFIWLLCDKMHSFLPVNVDRHNFSEFSNLLDVIENSRDTIKHFFGKREEAKITSLSEKIRTWLNTQQESSKESSLEFCTTERALTEQITDLFKEHIPNTPEETIYSGVCNFLGLFDIKCNPKTLAMREYRRKRTQIES